MAQQYSKIEKANFSTTPYSYQETSFPASTLYYFYKSNVCWDLFFKGSPGYISFYFLDYATNSWIPFKANDSSGYQYTVSGTLRFFHNCLTNYNDSAYSADTKVKDTTVTYNNHTYDTRGYSLWCIAFSFGSTSNNDFNIHSFGPGYLTDAEYNAVCKGRKIYCGGKGDPNGDDQHITTSSAASEWSTKFLPSLFRGNKITAALDRQCIPDWRWAKT